MKAFRLASWQIYAASAAACTAVTFGACAFIASPAVERHAQEHDLQLGALDRHRQLPKLTAQLTITRSQSAVVHEAIANTLITLQPTSAVNARLADLEKAAATCGVSLEEIHVGEPAAGAHYQSLPIRVAGSASYPRCVDFLHTVHESFPDIILKSMDVSAGGVANKPPTASTRFEFVWLASK